jgi:hypothetical protein
MACPMIFYRKINMSNPSWIREQPAGSGASRLRKNVIVAKIKEQYYEYQNW